RTPIAGSHSTGPGSGGHRSSGSVPGGAGVSPSARQSVVTTTLGEDQGNRRGHPHSITLRRGISSREGGEGATHSLVPEKRGWPPMSCQPSQEKSRIPCLGIIAGEGHVVKSGIHS